MKQSEYLIEDTSIVSHHIGEGLIIITFTDGYGYLFNAIRPGMFIVNQMIELAQEGATQNLSDFIERNASGDYYRRLE